MNTGTIFYRSSTRKRLVKRRFEICEQMRKEIYGSHLQMIEDAPSNFFPSAKWMRVRFGTEDCCLRFSNPLRVAYAHTHNTFAGVFPEDHPCYLKLKAIEEECEAINAEDEKITAELTSLLRGCNTVRQLLNTWPEIEQTLIDLCIMRDDVAPEPHPPALLRNLNEVFGFSK